MTFCYGIHHIYIHVVIFGNKSVTCVHMCMHTSFGYVCISMSNANPGNVAYTWSTCLAVAYTCMYVYMCTRTCSVNNSGWYAYICTYVATYIYYVLYVQVSKYHTVQ